MPSAEQWQWDSFGLIDQDLNRILWADLNNNLLTFRDRPDVKPLLAAVPDLQYACTIALIFIEWLRNNPWEHITTDDAVWIVDTLRTALAKAKPNLDA